MVQKYSKIETGFSFIDQKWGGVYPGGNYLIFGPKKSGKTILALNMIEHLLENKHSVLFLTSDRRKSLEIQAASIYFDIKEALSESALAIDRLGGKNNSIEKIKSLINENNPSILIVDEIIDNTIEEIFKTYNEFLEFLEDLEITSFFIASNPTNEKVKKYVKIIARNSTAIIQMQKTFTKHNYAGKIILKPNIGHFEGEFETAYKVEAVKGLRTFSENEKSLMKMLTSNENQEIVSENSKNDFEYSNVYSVEEFKFLIDSKIALSNKTGQRINIILYQLINNTIKTAELCNIFRKSLNKGDKICFTDQVVYILPEHGESSSIQKLSSKLDLEAQKLIEDSDNFEKYFIRKVQLLKSNFELH